MHHVGPTHGPTPLIKLKPLDLSRHRCSEKLGREAGVCQYSTGALPALYYDLGVYYSCVTAQKIGKLGSRAHSSPASENRWKYGDT